jgi:hypothetical protein
VGEQRYSFTLSPTSALDGSGWSAPRFGRFTPGKESRYSYRRLGRPQGPSGRIRKISPLLGSDSRTVQPVARRHTDYAIPAHRPNKTKNYFAFNNWLGATTLVTCPGRPKAPLHHRWMTHVSSTAVDWQAVIQLHKVQADTRLCREFLKRKRLDAPRTGGI